MMNLKRREFLKASAAIAAASAAGGFSCIEIANATPVSPPVVDRLSVRVLVDGAQQSVFAPGRGEWRQDRAASARCGLSPHAP
jgi:7,8-dihydropterin-6-yl-methyl-4-(beta-D-ribofuranosyl)aminobenzene 5'-phosphate synthase